MNNNIRMWRPHSYTVYLYFPLVAKELATEKIKTKNNGNMQGVGKKMLMLEKHAIIPVFHFSPTAQQLV